MWIKGSQNYFSCLIILSILMQIKEFEFNFLKLSVKLKTRYYFIEQG